MYSKATLPWERTYWPFSIASAAKAAQSWPSDCGFRDESSFWIWEVYPDINATVFDLPATLPVAEKTVKDAGLESRISLRGGDFNLDLLGGPYDVVLMSDILHYQTFETNQALVKKVYDHLAPGGQLVIKDRFLDDAGTAPAWTTAFAVHILVNTQQGSCYKTAEAMQWMTKAGFVSVIELEQTAVVQGVRPGR
jgi:SAM-dependent methyltransferase